MAPPSVGRRNGQRQPLLAFISLLATLECAPSGEVGGELVGSSPPSGGGATAATLQVDIGVSQGPFHFSPGKQLGSVHMGDDPAVYGSATMSALRALGLRAARVWVKFKDAHTNGVSSYYIYLDRWHGLADVLLVNWRTGYDLVGTGGWTESTLAAAQRDLMAALKSRYPKIELIECENEPDHEVGDMTAYYLRYKLLYKVVNDVNALGLPGPPLKIRGPVTTSPAFVRPFLDQYVADGDPGKRLDFIAYHQYLLAAGCSDPSCNKDNPAMVRNERAAVSAHLSARGLPTTLPIYVTETGIFPGAAASSLGFEPDLHVQTAGMAAMHYYYLEQPLLHPFHWTIDHPTNDRKDMFLDTAAGTPRPYYNLQRLQGMLPAMRHSSSTSLSSRGIGLGSLAGGDTTTVAVMSWNYQWTGSTYYDAAVSIANLPSAFRTRNVRVERWYIPNHIHEGGLIQVENTVIGPRTGGSYTTSAHRYNANEVRLLRLTAL